MPTFVRVPWPDRIARVCVPLASSWLLACAPASGPAPTNAPLASPVSSASPASSASVSPSASPASSDDAALARVAVIHGGAGPWVVAGYRMGEYALRALGLEHGSTDLEVIHYSPREVQYSCIADGAAAATGASVGKLNLTMQEAPRAETRTVYRRRSTGQVLELRFAPTFAARFVDVPRARLAEAGREVMRLRDDQVFEIVRTENATVQSHP